MPRLVHPSAAVVMVVIVALANVKGCVELLGHAHLAMDNSTEWDYAYLGDNWEGVNADGSPWTCKGGHFQSPIDLPRTAATFSPGIKTKFHLTAQVPSDLPSADVWNNGHTIQVQNFSSKLAGMHIPTLSGSITDMVARRIQNVPGLKWVHVPAIQFHFHTASEHQFEGMQAALELHVVHRSAPNAFTNCPNGCLAVAGMMVKVVDDVDNEALAPIFDVMPFTEMTHRPLPAGAVLDFNKIYPKNRAYISYKGSLTSPPCTEGLLWHVFTEPIYISRKQYAAYRNAVGSKKCNIRESDDSPFNCTLAAWDENYRLTQPRLGRHIYMSTA